MWYDAVKSDILYKIIVYCITKYIINDMNYIARSIEIMTQISILKSYVCIRPLSEAPPSNKKVPNFVLFCPQTGQKSQKSHPFC